MHEDLMKDANFSIENNLKEESEKKNLNSLFDNLSADVANVSRYISEVAKNKKSNDHLQKELYEEREKFEKSKLEFNNYITAQKEELKKIKLQTDQYITLQNDKLRKAESDFRTGMTNSLSQLELEKKSLEIEKETFLQERAQFESYRALELSRINQAKQQIDTDKDQFAKYKEIAMKKIELDNKNLEQQCLKFRDIMGQFNANFDPVGNIEE